MFGAGPEEPPWPVVAARDGWFVVFMIGAGADEPSIPGAAEIPKRIQFFLSELSPHFIGKSIDRMWKFQKRFRRAKTSAVGSLLTTAA